LGGVFLERELQTSSRLFEFVFRMFSLGDTALPAAGMGAIPAQLASGFPANTVRLRTPVRSVTKDGVVLDSGGSRHAPAVVVATEGPEAARLLQEISLPPSRRVTCLYFAADTPPIADALLMLNGDDDGPVNNVCVPSAVAPTYAPAGAALISVSVLEAAARQEAALEAAVRAQLSDWFGPTVHRWQHLRTYRLHHALPAQAPPALRAPQRPVRLRPGLYVCGDHRDTASIHGAMVSGRRTAASIIADFNQS
jgi:phytoene dehydrogenase-like protein